MHSRLKLIILVAVPWLLLAGQVASEIGDPYLTVENGRPRPSEGRQVITLRAWGLLQRNSESLELDCGDQGLANARLSVSTEQLLTSVATIGFIRPMTVTYHCHEGNRPMVPD